MWIIKRHERRPFAPSMAMLLALLIAVPSAPATAAGASIEREHARAVELARAGEHGPALEILTRLAEREDAPAVVRYDLVTVLAWARRDAEALAAADGMDLAAAPAYMLEELGRAARAEGRFDLARTAYRLALAAAPERLDARVGLALVTADLGDAAGARAQIAELRRQYPDDPQVARAAAYVAEAGDDLAAALGETQRALKTDPERDEARRAQILLAARLGAPHRALELAVAHPGLITPQEEAGIRADAAAITLRWGMDVAPEDPAARFADVDRALALLAENRNAARAAANTGAETVARRDTVVALEARERHREAVRAYEELLSDGDTPPPYVRVAAADAHRALGDPRAALPLYESAIASEDDPFDTRLKRVYVLSEAGRDADAIAAAEQLAAGQPVTRPTSGGDEINPRHLDAYLALALAHRFAGDAARARKILSRLSTLAPGNRELISERAALLLADGHARRALDAYRAGLSADPDHPGLREGEVYALLDLLAYREAARKVAELEARFPGSEMAERLARVTANEHRPLWTLSATRRTSSGTALGSSGTVLDSYLYGSRRGKVWRPFVHGRWETGRFPGGAESVRHGGLGVEWHVPRLHALAELHADRDGGNRSGLLAEVEYRLVDPLTVGLMHDTNTLDVPLEALQSGVDAWQTRGSAAWHPRFRSTVSASLTRSGFSDSNRRTAYSAAWDEQWFSGRRWWLSTRADLYRSTNTLSGAPYYNPAADRAMSLTAEPRQRIRLTPPARHGERFFDHGVAATVGRYAQQGFATRRTWKLGYDQWWQWHDRLTVSWGAALGRAAYDGAGETEREFLVSLERRF